MALANHTSLDDSGPQKTFSGGEAVLFASRSDTAEREHSR